MENWPYGSELLFSEANVAARVLLERQARGWSTTELAQRMTAAGVPLNQSAVWRIESGTPRRKISLDEALGFSKVFELPLEDLMAPPQEGLDLEARRLLQDCVDAFFEKRAVEDRLHLALVALDEYRKSHPDPDNAVFQQCIRLIGDDRYARAMWELITDGGFY
ncbi:helix-turn-helix domain-containing protein [Streptacidiphilus cavernicola]|uniref:Helix-turn-helix domain-containing protein n=1 Tax=Streptacidiphilus cavernicola TaxID=3342716 RepID=A0ABV6VVQ4_9ACTN